MTYLFAFEEITCQEFNMFKGTYDNISKYVLLPDELDFERDGYKY